MSVTYSFILPLILHLLIFLTGIGETFTAGVQSFNSPRVAAAQQRERRQEMMETARGGGTYSAEVEQMRRNRMMERQMRQVRSRTGRIRF